MPLEFTVIEPSGHPVLLRRGNPARAFFSRRCWNCR